MHKRVEELFHGINRLKKHHNFSDDAFCIVYGSYPTDVIGPKSDIDLFVINKVNDINLFKKIKDVVVKVHGKFDIPLDEEVPFGNKLIATFAELEKASHLNGMDMKNGKFTIPKLLRTKAYLGSEQIKLRLLFNAFSTPHYVLWSNSYYKLIEKRIIENLFWLAIDLLNTNRCTLAEVKDILLVGENSRYSEEYLGYKLYPKVVHKVYENVKKAAMSLNDTKNITYNSNTEVIEILDKSPLKILKKEFIGSSKIKNF